MRYVLALVAILAVTHAPQSFSEGLEVYTNSAVYSPIHNLQIYGTALPEENLIIRLFAPDGSIASLTR